VVVTLDADFHAILAVSAANGPSTIRLRVQGWGAARVADAVADLVRHFQRELCSGCLLTVKSMKTTCRMLPVGLRREP
jgi:predicted nuclease of predicted toxin-antitoxin system